MPKILVTDPLSEEGLAQLFEATDMQVDLKIGIPATEIIEIIGDYDALLVRSQTKVTADIITAAKNLKVIGRAGVGVDNIDVRAATKAGILVINAPDGNTITTAEFSFAMMMALARHIPQATKSLLDGRWERNKFVGAELRDKVLGIVGLGRIGAEVAKRAQVFSMHVIAYDPFLTPARAEKLGVKAGTLEDVITKADFITVHTPLTKETHHLIGEKELSRMKKGVRIINCARGGIIDEMALCKALDDGIVQGAAFDVFEKEPPIDHPLLQYPQVIATPHLGASTNEAQINVAVDVAGGIVQLLRGGVYPHTVNLPSLPAELRQQIQPFADLGEVLGSLAAQVMQQGVQSVQIQYEGEPSQLQVDPITRATLKGILQQHYGEEVHLISVALLAEEIGIDVSETKIPRNQTYGNHIRVTLVGDTESVTVAGTYIKGLGIRIVDIGGYPLDISPSDYLVTTWHHDVPGIIGSVGSVLGKAGINIASMQVGRVNEGGQALMVIAVDRAVADEHVHEIESTNGILRVKYIELPL